MINYSIKVGWTWVIVLHLCLVSVRDYDYGKY